MKYAVHCYDNKYGGLQGICFDFTLDVDNYVEVEEEAKKQAIELVQSYGFLFENYGKMFQPMIIYIMNWLIKCAAYEIVPIRDDAPVFIEEAFFDFVKKWSLK